MGGSGDELHFARAGDVVEVVDVLVVEAVLERRQAAVAQHEVQQQVVLGGGVLHHAQRGLHLLLPRVPHAQPLHAVLQVHV